MPNRLAELTTLTTNFDIPGVCLDLQYDHEEYNDGATTTKAQFDAETERTVGDGEQTVGLYFAQDIHDSRDVDGSETNSDEAVFVRAVSTPGISCARTEYRIANGRVAREDEISFSDSQEHGEDAGHMHAETSRKATKHTAAALIRMARIEFEKLTRESQKES